ncbi:MAG: CPBP family intramembrane glutamic endopeptidase [Edaphobacter sp.]
MSDLTSNPSSPSVRPFNPDQPVAVPPVFQEPAPIEGETALFYQHTEGTPPADPPSRIPHLGHALLFLLILGFFFFTDSLLLGLTHPGAAKGKVAATISTKLLIGSQALSYIGTLGLSWLVFPLIWKRPFAEGLQLNPDAARRNAFRLIPIGLILSFAVQAATSLISLPKTIPLDDFFRTRSDVWLVTAFGILVAPFFEEVAFRGFLLPAFAIAYDWLSLPRTPAAREAWHATNRLTRNSLIFSAVLTSILFALIHGFQTAFTWPVLALLFCVSLILSYVRLRLRSVMASTLIHVSYNTTIFAIAFIATGGYRHLEKLAH